MFSLSSLLESRDCVLHLRTANPKESETNYDWMHSLACTTWSRKGAVMVLDTTKLKNKKRTSSPGMRGRDAARKFTLKVNILQVFTIDSSEIKFIVNHNSQSDGQSKSAKSGMNLQKKTIHVISLQRKGEDTKINGISPWTNQAKMALWNFDPIFELLSPWKIVYTTSQANKCKSLFLQNNTGGGIPLQAHRGGTSLDGIGSELIRVFFKKNTDQSSFCCSWFRLQLMAIHCNRRGVYTDTPRTSFFSCTVRMLNDVSHHNGTRTCLCASPHTHGHPWWAVDRLFFVSLFVALSFSMCLSFTFLFPFHFYLYSVLNLFFHVDNAKAMIPCASANWRVLLSGRIHSSHRLWAQAPWRLPPLRDYCKDLPGWIRRRGYGALVLVWCRARRWDHRESAIFTTVHSGARRTSEPETSLSLSWRMFVAISVLFFAHTRTGRPVHELSSWQKTNVKS